MQALKVTTPHDDGTYHIVYINSETGVGLMSPGRDGHMHQLQYDPPREPRPPSPAVPPQIDPMTGQPVMVQDPGDPGKEEGSWIVGPPMMQDGSIADVHEHEVVDYKAEPDESKESEDAIIKDCLQLWREARALVSDCKKKGREAEDFYAGKQWDEQTEQLLNSMDRAALTINEVAPNIDTLIGYQMEQRTDIRVLPQEAGDQRVADMLNIVIKKVTDNCAFPREETKVFKDACVPGMGVFNVYMDHSNNIQGEIRIERFPWDDVDYGPHEKEDLSDCEYEVKSRMQSIAKLKQMFGKKAKEIEENYSTYAGRFPDVEKLDNGIAGEHTDYRLAPKIDDIPFTVDGTLPLVDVQKKQFRLVQVSRKVYKEVTVLFNEEESYFFTAYDWKPDDIKLAALIPGFQFISQVRPRIRITRFCGGVVLSDENPADLPLHDFYSVPVYGYRQNGEFWGKVEAAKDPQRELNKRRSQAMDIVNRLGAAVIYTEPDMFKDDAEKERFKKKRSNPGAVFDLNNVDRSPKTDPGAEFPSPLVQLMQLDQQNLQRIMNVVVEQEGANESGAMFLEKKKGRLTGNQFLFDNLSFAKQKLGKIIIALIKRYYDPERLQRLLNAQYTKQPFEIGGEDFSKFSKEEIIEMLESADMLEYDVIVTESAFSATTRLGVAKVLFDALKQGAPIPPELPLEFIDMPSDTRARITQQMQAQQEAQAQANADVSNSEISKTLIAKGLYTIAPEKAHELGLVPVGANMPLANGAENPNNPDNTQADIYASQLASGLAG